MQSTKLFFFLTLITFFHEFHARFHVLKCEKSANAYQKINFYKILRKFPVSLILKDSLKKANFLLILKSSDALELKFGEPSRAELEIFRAEPSRAGCLWKASWIRAGFFSKPISINVTAIFCNSIYSFIPKKFSKGKAILWKLLLHKINNN